MEKSYKKTDSIKNILKYVIQDAHHKFYTQVYQLEKHWDSVVGKKLYPLTKPKNIYKKRLYITCAHSGLVQTLQFHKQNILDKIMILYNDKVLLDDIMIEDIRFGFGEVKHNINSAKKIKTEKKEIIKNNDYTFEKLQSNLELFFSKK